MLKVRRLRGFTLIELLVVMAVIAILVALLLPAVQQARESARRTTCKDHLHNLALAIHNYHEAHDRFPLNYALWSRSHPVDGNSVSWMVGILPYIEQSPLYDRIDFNYGVRNDPRNDDTLNSEISNQSVAQTVLPVFVCPSDTHKGNMGSRANYNPPAPGRPWAVNNYKGVAGANWCWGSFPSDQDPWIRYRDGKSCNGLDRGNGIFFRGDQYPSCAKMADMQDGSSNTFVIGEAVPRWCTHTWWWHANGSTATCSIPLNADAQCQNTGNRLGDLDACWWDWPNNYSFMSRHVGGAHFAMGDGRVIFVTENIDYNIYRSMATMNGGEAVSDLE